MIVAITEFTLMQPWRLAAFMRFAIPSANQAKNAEGNLHARTNADSWHTHRTISAWTSMEAMKKYMMTGAHMKAMVASRRLMKHARSIHLTMDHLPDWEEAMVLLEIKQKEKRA